MQYVVYVYLYAAVKPTCYNINLCYFDLWFYVHINNFSYTKNKNYKKEENINQRTNGPVNAHLSLNIMVFNPSAGADEALGRFSFFQNNQYSVHLPISWLLLAFPFK